MHLLVIEDDAFKSKRICNFLTARLSIPVVEVERSVTTGLTRLIAPPPPDAILLDMSLSTFDVGPRETGGRPQNFGGIAVLDHMVRRNIEIPVAVITQFETFPKDGREVGLEVIRAELSAKFPRIFRGLIYYNSRETDWENSVEQFLAGVRSLGHENTDRR
jgi:CheY-like chemotaxis protein